MTDLVEPVQVLKDGKPVISLEGHGDGSTASAMIRAGINGRPAQAFLSDGKGQLRIVLDSADGRVTLWKSGDPLMPELNRAVTLRADVNTLQFRADGKQRLLLDGNNANAFLGGNGAHGDVVLWASGGDNATPAAATVHLDGANGNLRLGGPGVDGNLALFRADMKQADSGDFSKAMIHLNGNTGDIILSNADCAEDFDIVESEEIHPGAVMIACDDGRLCQSTEPYDSRVAGVACGAGECKPGIILGRTGSSSKRLPIALMGKVYCRVDAQFSSVRVGDLLTTSPTPGHAMKATDRFKAFGAVIGKALQPLAQGMGLIPILVALQ